MTRSAKVIRAAGRATVRRHDHSVATRRRLVECATELFAERGYGGTSLDEVVAAARVTKGALYHHFSGKQALFEAVFGSCEDAAVAEIRSEVRRGHDPWERAKIGVRAFVTVCQRATFRRIVMQEGPAALGYDRFRDADEGTTYGLVRELVMPLLTPYDVPDGITDTLTRVFYGAMTASGMAVAAAEDPEQYGREVETVLGVVLSGLRTAADPGGDRVDGAPTSRA